jgi:ubiquinone/menaquinone biosynthesis C-methylase UbiE
MSTMSKKRLPHAVLNLETRYFKAKKIEELLSLHQDREVINLLEVGTGSGGIAYYFANLANLKYKVTAVDVVDNRLAIDGFEFQLVDDVRLPFGDGTFDVVISNHVIEHVGDVSLQMEHLHELKRILKKTGVGYLAVPNRWMLIEPHYKLIFLSWLPKRFRTSYLKFSGKGSYYDCEPLEKKEIENMFQSTGLKYKNLCVEALKLTFNLEKDKALLTKLINLIPNCVLAPFISMIPTHIYIFKK